jgi:sulfur carrier protein
MKILLNGEPTEVATARLSAALEEVGYGDAKIATALNGEFVPASARPERELKDGDRLEVVAPRQGG